MAFPTVSISQIGYTPSISMLGNYPMDSQFYRCAEVCEEPLTAIDPYYWWLAEELLGREFDRSGGHIDQVLMFLFAGLIEAELYA